MSDIIAEFIQKQERMYQRKLRPYEGYLLREFWRYLEKGNSGLTKLSNAQTQHVSQVTNGFVTPVAATALRVALITEEIGHLTGGRYYAWFMAVALCELGYDVTLYTNSQPTYFEAFAQYKKPKVVLMDKPELENIDVVADIYISSPVLGNIAVTKLSHKYQKPSYVMVFDPSPMQLEFTGSMYSGWTKLTPLIKDSDVTVISLTDATAKYCYEWLNKRKEQIVTMYPCINTRALEQATLAKERGDYVVFVSRMVKHKKFEDVLYAVSKTDMRLKVISSNDGIGRDKLLRDYPQLKDRVDFHFNISDSEKFEIISGARAVISASIFEGFGMWAIEALACGTPLVCYEYPTIREIEKVGKAKNFYFAKWNSPKDLGEKLIQAITEKKYTKRNYTFDFDAFKQRAAQVFSPEPRIGVITICLNEEKFIAASLSSVIRHKNIKKVAVVEGAVNLFAHAASSDGLSKDSTASIMHEIKQVGDGKKIIYERYGWAQDKAELRNRALQLLGKGITHVLIVDADEIYDQADLDKLVQAMKDNPTSGAFFFDFYHFFKKRDQIAVGSQWNSQMFRCFKYDIHLSFGHHSAPVIFPDGQFVNKALGSVMVKDMHVYHLGYLKPESEVVDKLEYYKKRDTHLSVNIGTYLHWREGRESQPTHGGGTVEKFTGTYPFEMQILIDGKII